jgi:recombination protein RecR
MKEAQKLQQQMEALQAEAAKKKVQATAGGGMVTVEANGKQEILSIKIDREVINPEDAQMLEDLVLAACNEALRQSREMVQAEMSKLTAGRSPARASGQPEPVARLVEALQRLPGIGPKTAQRLTFFLLKRPADEVKTLAESLTQLKELIVHCRICFNVTEEDPCRICSDPRRDQRIFCVVEEPNDLLALERTGEFRGRYHVLLGALSPLDGIGPEDLRVRELLFRLETPGVEEIILATNPSVEGEATAIYLAKLLKPLGLRITRIARGLPVGGDLEYADEVTCPRLSKAAARSVTFSLSPWGEGGVGPWRRGKHVIQKPL